jgi:hypothetical protein
MNSQAEADFLLAEYQHNKQAIIRGLREKIAFLEARSADRTYAQMEYEGLYRLHRRVAELEGRDSYDRQIEATLEAMREVVS